MSKGAKIFLAVTAVVAVLIVASGTLLAASVVRAGTLRVKIQEPGPSGTNVDLAIPAALVHLGLTALPWMLDDEIPAEIRTGFRVHRPAVAAALLELEDAPDAVLVHIRDASESVRIAKKGRSVEISVDDPSGSFKITLPASLMGRIAREIA